MRYWLTATALFLLLVPKLAWATFCLVQLDDSNPVVTWQSDVLANPDEYVTTGKGLQSILGQVVGSEANTQLVAEIKYMLAQMVGEKVLTPGIVTKLIQSEEFWRVYLNVYDRFVSRSPQFTQLVKFGYDNLNISSGTQFVADLGAGSGAWGSAFLQANPELEIVNVDLSADPSLVKAKFGLLQANDNVSFFYGPNIGNILSLDTETAFQGRKLDAIILNNVLYSIPQDKQLDLVRMMAKNLKVGGRLFLGNPNGRVLQTAKDLVDFSMKVAIEGLENGARATQKEIALVMYMIYEVLSQRDPNFPSPLRLVEQFDLPSTGLRQVVLSTDLYFGTSAALVFEKTSVEEKP